MFSQRLRLTLVGIAAAAAMAGSPVGAFAAQDPVVDQQATLAVVSIEVPVAASSDDAGLNAAWDWCFYGTNNNEIYFGQCADGTDITSGFRFVQVPIPQGAHIVEAHIRFTVDGPYTDEMTVRFRGEASGNAATFDDTSRPDTRPLIPDVWADWAITAADPWTLGESRDSPPLTAIVQAIVDRADWISGNALAIITQNVGTATGAWRHRRVIGYERPVWYPGTEYAARLVVTYGDPPVPPSPAPDWSAFGGQAGAYFGHPVAPAGDVNGDGYADAIVGAPHYDAGEVDEGRAFVYYGTSAGLSPTPNWIAESNQAGALFGYPVSTAGDVNGDGYSDVIVGAQNYDDAGTTDAGRAYLYFGSAAGLSATPNWIATGDQTGDQFGVAVDTAGDINGDGYADIIVGANTYDNGETDEGRTYVYYGSPAGPSATPDWTAEGNRTGAYFGSYLGTAGDVNGDGYADLAVGAIDYDHGQANEGRGRAFVYYGSATGLSATADWTAEGDQDGARFSYPVVTAGDVNGDGYADLAVDAPYYDNGQIDEGRAFVYFGSASGLSITPNWTAESDQADAALYPVGTAGDVNGDGYADLVVGDTNYMSVQWRDGRAFAYYGNHGGLSMQPQQRRNDNSAPIAYLGQSDEPDTFRLVLLGRTPFGRGKVKLEWEVKPRGVLFDGAGLQRSAEWVDTGAAGAQLDEVVTGLQEDTPYHWRVRLLYHPATTPFQQASRWLTTPWNGWNEARLRTSGPATAVTLATMEAAPEASSRLSGWILAWILAIMALSLGVSAIVQDGPTRELLVLAIPLELVEELCLPDDLP